MTVQDRSNKETQGMNANKIRILFIIIFLSAGIISACSFPSGQPTPTPSPSATSMPQPTPTETETPLPPTPEFAPVCDSSASPIPTSALCQVPIAEAGSTFCESKKPYNLIYINQGAAYDVLTNGFWCTNGGLKNGKQVLTCTGPMASDYQVSVCDPACAIPTANVKVTQCPQGFNYNDIQGCCTQEPVQFNQNCTVLNLETTRCVVNCSVFKKRNECNSNYIACEWDTHIKKCMPR